MLPFGGEQPGRFHFKNNAKVAYGEKLDLAPYMATVPLDSQPVRYTLYGVVVHLDHMNSTHFGHYVSFVRTGDDRWFDCDDMQVAVNRLRGPVFSCALHLPQPHSPSPSRSGCGQPVVAAMVLTH